MSRPRFLCLVLLALLASPAFAAPARQRQSVPSSSQETRIERLLAWAQGLLVSISGKTGALLDPFGAPQPAAPPPASGAVQGDSTDTGASLDPFGVR